MFLRRAFVPILFALPLLSCPAALAAQSPTFSVWLTWAGAPVSTLVQGDCYDFNAGPNAEGTTLDIAYNVNGGPVQYIFGWPTLDANGQAENICTSMNTPVGQIAYLAVRNAAGGDWIAVNSVLNMRPQATGLSFNGSSGFAGVGSYVLHVGNLQNRNVRVRYNHDNSYNVISNIAVDGAGNYYSGIFDHYLFLGQYLMTGVQDAAAQPDNWVMVNAPYTILPPQPQSLSVAPASIIAGAGNASQYRMSASNGGGMSLSLRYAIAYQGQQSLFSADGWPWLYGTGTNGWDGISDYISAARCTRPGSYHFYQVKNSLNGEDGWKNIDTWLTVTGSGQPNVSFVSPPTAGKGQSVTVTVYGQQFCGVQLQTNYSGLSFSNISNPDWSDGTSFTATFTVAPNAAVGDAPVTILARGGSTTLTFGITQNATQPTITGVNPSSAAPGSTTTVTLTGTNLQAPALSTTWSGLTFSNVVPDVNGNSLTAAFAISASAPAGNPQITVTTPGGSATTSAFSILPSSISRREYIYFGDRVIAVDSP